MQRIAVVGAGPSGIFAVNGLLARDDVLVDVIDRSPTPFGLVRYGVAPDHLKIKSVERKFTQTMVDPRVSFHGNVEVGRDVSLAELRASYAAIVLATGAARSRRLGIPGDDLPGHIPAGQFVDWYNSRPGASRPAGIPARRVAVIGAGNVALDSARVLLKAGTGLAHTDVTDEVLAVLDRRPTNELTMVIRRGAADTKFSPAELLDLDKLEGVDILVDPEDLKLIAEEEARAGEDRFAAARVRIFRKWSATPATGAPKVLRFRFREAPVRILGDDRVEALELSGERGVSRLPVDTVVSAIGYNGERIDGAPFDDRRGRIVNDRGRVAPGIYTVGWAKRGPSGVIGSNKSCAAETVALLLEDLPSIPVAVGLRGIAPLLHARGRRVVDWRGWTAIDAAETAVGASKGRLRTKIADHDRLVEIALGRTLAPTLKETES
ncbi:FAD-dependent oxidoreductase [Amycolatopsis sp. NPDC005232]|uniref:FAD-dependent oxidoreductase n=1 Tax=Amycolatopsis sp. NPDC005232 TaxID=3157027 RepID=UPI0033B5EDE8